jgi:heme-degrading monooxygenase HmoA
MAIAEIIQFSAESKVDARTLHTTVDDRIQKAVDLVKGASSPKNFVIGAEIQDKGAIQVTSEWEGVQDYANFGTTPEFNSFTKNLRNSCGDPRRIFHVDLARSVFGPDGPATANVVEYVSSYFPVSVATLEFRKQIEKDFFRFDEIFNKNANGNKGWTYGWALDELDHENIKGEKATCFFIVRGWESFGHFEQSTKNDEFKEAIPILLGWKAPFKMVGAYFTA